MRVTVIGSLALGAALAGCNDTGLGVVNALPLAEILTPSDGDALYGGAHVLLQGRATDRDTRPDLLRATWRVGGVEVCPSAPPDADGLTTCEWAVPDTASASVQLEVLDVGNGSDVSEITVSVLQNTPPTVGITTPTATQRLYADAPVSLDAFVSDVEDAAGDLIVTWDVDGDTLADAPTTPSSDGQVMGETAALSEGAHTLRVTVTDTGDKTAYAAVSVLVGPANRPPACALLAPSSGSVAPAGAAVAFTASASDPDVEPTQLTVSLSSDIDGEIDSGGPDGDGLFEATSASLSLGNHVISLRVTDDVGATCTDTATLTVWNTPPTAPILEITPAAPTTLDALVVSQALPSFDAEGNDVTYTTVWLKDGVLQPTLLGETLTASATARGQVWTARVTPDDGYGPGAPGQTAVTIGDAAPTIAGVAITPSEATSATPLTCHASGMTDPDGDPVSVAFAWHIGGVQVGQGDTLAAGVAARGDRVTCAATPSDDVTTGVAVSSADVVIGNLPPSVADVRVGPTPLTVRDVPTCAWTFSDPDAADMDGSALMWSVNGVAAGDGVAPDVAAVVGDEVSCAVTASDGTDTGNTVSGSAVVVNTAPSSPGLSLTPVAPTTVHDLTVAISTPSEDAEGSVVTYGVVWLRDGAVVSGQTALVLPASATARGEVWTARVTPSDGDLLGDATDAVVTIGNALPSLASAVIEPATAFETSTLSCPATGVADADLDPVTVATEWRVNGVVAGTDATLQGVAFDRGQRVTCTLTPSDGLDDGAPVTSAVLTVADTPPAVADVVITPAHPTGRDQPVCSWSFADADPGDADQSSVSWTVNDVPAGSQPTLTATLTPDDVVACTVTAGDGTLDGNTASAWAVVDYAGPKIAAVTVDTSDGGPPTAEHGLVCTYTGFTSPTGGADRSTYEWYVGSQLVGTGQAWVQPPRLTSGYLHDDVVRCVVTPFDGVEAGRPREDALTILNAPPTAPTASVPATVGPGADLTCSVGTASTDADGDPITYAFAWEVNAYGDTDGDGLSDEIDPLPSDFSYFDSTRDFGPSRGVHGWSYDFYDNSPVGWQPMGYAGGAWTRTDGYYGATRYMNGYIDAVSMEGGYAEVSRVWTAPFAAPAHFVGSTSLMRPTVCSRSTLTLQGPISQTIAMNCYGSGPRSGSFNAHVNVGQGVVQRFNHRAGIVEYNDQVNFHASIYLSSPQDDVDGDGVLDEQDRCQLGDDAVDLDGNGTPDACDSAWTLFGGATDAATSSTVAWADIAPNETWRCRIVASDGRDFSAPAFGSARAVP